jgi:hypothetical protein
MGICFEWTSETGVMMHRWSRVHEASPPPAPDSSATAAPVTATENTPDPSPPSLTRIRTADLIGKRRRTGIRGIFCSSHRRGRGTGIWRSPFKTNPHAILKT